MGWCSGTYIFDSVASIILDEGKEFSKKEILKELINALEERDWDCERESAYFDHPLVQEIFKELKPYLFEEDGE
jgi:hypothetical protein